MVGASAVHAQTICDEEWESIADKFTQGTDIKAILSMWEKKKGTCGESSFYYLKLGWLLLENAKFTEAEAAFNKGLDVDKDNDVALKLALADLPFQQSTRAFADINWDLLNKAHVRMQTFIEEYPDLPDGYASLTGVMLIKKEFKSVIENGLKAKKLGGNPYAYRNLAIAYYEVAQDKNATVAASEAIELSESLQADAELMLTVALAYSNLKEFKYSLGMLRLLVQSNPESQSTPEFQRITSHIREQYLLHQEAESY
ncbi:hypothetical protein GCM10007852_36840 [Agaribacter marinus]|uniref:Tetratricopeptide repeat protein n=2 Tax=Agaribacter marinus TaxID=1431249 RepID=A0AA37T373_9ALTE|nr:hypothetical protein GCM10007852_36840 [Agaribacter marinus]